MERVLGGPVSVSFHGDNGNATSKSANEILLYPIKDDIHDRYSETSGTSLASWFDAYYSDLGTKESVYTPTRFALPVRDIVLLDSGEDRFSIIDNTRDFLVDFSDPSQTTTVIDVDKSKFDSLWIFLANNIRGYEAQIDFTASAGHNFTFSPDLIDLGSNKYRSIYCSLTPDLSVSPTGHGALFYDNGTFDSIIFTNYVDEPTLVLPENGETIHTADIIHNEGFTSSTDRFLLLLPWEGVEIPGDASSMIFTLYWDLNNAIEIYDNAGDDKPMLANKFWNAISLKATFE